MSFSFSIGGDLGDSFVSLAIIRAFPGKHIVRFVDRPPTLIVDRVPLIESLFLAQPYIASVQCSEEKSDFDLTRFRRWHSSSTCLKQAQLVELNFQAKSNRFIPDDPWLFVEPDESFAGKVIIARSPRYRNKRWETNWQTVVDHYGSRIIFVGLPSEYAEFCASFGRVVHLQCRDFLEMAKAMAGASLVIANQSSPHAVAMGLGRPIIQETCDWQPDVIFDRDNVQYSADGACVLPDVSGSGTLTIEPFLDIPEESANTSRVPPGHWQWDGLPPCPHFTVQQALVSQKEGCDQREAGKKLFRHNAIRARSFFFGVEADPMAIFKTAYDAAFNGALKRAFQDAASVLKP